MTTAAQDTVKQSFSANGNHTLKQETYLTRALRYLEKYCTSRLSRYFGKETTDFPILPLPEKDDTSPLANFVRRYGLVQDELTILLIAIVPHVLPGFFDRLIQLYLPQGGEFPDFGGIRGEHHRGTLPTGETALFILAGTDVQERLKCLSLFDDSSFLFRQHILSIETVRSGEPMFSGRLILEPEFAEVFTTGKVNLPKLSMNFPAQHLTTQMEWDDLVLDERIIEQIKELENWIRHNDTLLYEWGMVKKLKPGYKALFYGPPGTGKTLTATLLGKYTGREVFRIDLSTVVSKYIGETEKNLASLFDKAEHKDWILFFDEADAIFGKRTGVRDAHDKYANQEVSYLLQRIETYSGLTILASNFRTNIDEAFVRRFNSLIYFPSPNYNERLQLWKKAFPQAIGFKDDVDLKSIASDHELTGSHIMNIVQYVCLEALEKNTNSISHEDIINGVRRELSKEGK